MIKANSRVKSTQKALLLPNLLAVFRFVTAVQINIPSIDCKFFCFIYRRQTKLRKGNVFTPVCQSFCSQGGYVHAGIHPPPRQAGTPLGRQVPTDRQADTPPGRQNPPNRQAPPCTDTSPPLPADGYCCGQYASYWNAYLLICMYASTVMSVMCKICHNDRNFKIFLL